MDVWHDTDDTPTILVNGVEFPKQCTDTRMVVPETDRAIAGCGVDVFLPVGIFDVDAFSFCKTDR